MQARHLAIATLLLAACAPAAASQVSPSERPLDSIKPNMPYWSMRRILDANTTTSPITIRASSAVPAVFGWNTNVTMTTNAEMTACLVPTTSVSIGGQDTANATTITDSVVNANAGPGACRTLQANETWTIQPRWDYARRTISPGYRNGICSAAQDTNLIDPTMAIPFCRVGVNADCTDAGVTGGTCIALSTSQAVRDRAATAGGLFLVGKALAANTDWTVMVER